ncbi:cache domain-containing sensor histidine kinase [Acetivibrio cellulolyticus]|uniref:cache domain-containing sensor histidine kinase n=1 Tax=Acetivibrio cellulolyticus TaxID=35830 RepID=UPI0001E2E73C|nr:histidine kinase [Acetivibrio cellulolyticus]
MVINIYKGLFGRKFFNKVFLIYSLTTICAIIIIAYMSSLNIDISLKNKETENNGKVLTSINAYFEQKIASSRSIAVNIYTSRSINAEIVYLMKNGYYKHLQYKYDKLLSSPENKYNGFESYFDSCLYRDRDILGISIYSGTQSEAFVYSNTGLSIYDKDPVITNYFKNQSVNDQGVMIIPTHPVNFLNDSNASRVFTVVYQVKDTFSSDVSGYITIDYSIDGIKNEFSKYSNDYKGTVLIFTQQGKTIFDSSDTYYNNDYPFYSSLNDTKGASQLYKNNIVNTVISLDSGTLAAAILPQQLLEDGRNRSGRTIFLISFACIIATLLLTFITMLTFSKRIGSLMSGIKSIDSGDLSSRITIKSKQDEISEIAGSFNNMCDHLNEYIEKVYMSEIKQKQAQLKALEAQINPHFLYNTLESIRMRALVNGSKDVAEMIYLLSSLFRNSVKGKFVITIGEEIKYCKMYIELFNMRFIDNIQVTFDIKEDTACKLWYHEAFNTASDRKLYCSWN